MSQPQQATKGPWRRIHKPSLLARALLVPAGLFAYFLGLILGYGLLQQGNYLSGALVLAFMQVASALLLRAVRWQGLSINPEGDLRLASVYGQRIVTKDAVDRILIDVDGAMVYVWTGGQVLWLEVGSRLGVSLPARKRIEAAFELLHSIYGDRVSLGVLTREEAVNVVALEFSFKGFSRILASPLVWVPVLIGQLLLLGLRG